MPSSDLSSQKFTFTSPRQQLFAFPPDVISSIVENPTSHKGLMKLYQTCKYFYSKRPILIVDFVAFGTSLYDNRYQETNIRIKQQLLSISNLKTPIWFTNRIYFGDYSNQNRWLFKFYRYSIKVLELCNRSMLQYEDFILLTSEKMLESVTISESFISHSDGTIVTLADMLQHLPNLKKFEGEIDETCSSEILAQLNEIQFKNKISFSLQIYDVHPTFDLNLFCQFFVKNSNPFSRNDIQVQLEAREKLKPAFQKMDPKWKKDDNNGLRELFFQIEK